MWPFDQNNQQMYQQYANAWDQGTYGQIPEQEARQNYSQFILGVSSLRCAQELSQTGTYATLLINDVNPRIARAELVYFSELFLCQKYVFSDPMPTQIAMPISPAQSWDLQEDGRWMQGISAREYATVITVLQRMVDNLE